MKGSIRRRSAIALALALSFMCLQPAVLAANTARADAYNAASPITIDGSLGEWNTTSPLVLAEQSQLVRDAEIWGGPMDLSARIYVMWDDMNLYIGADVTEDTPFRSAEMLALDAQDSFVLYFSTSPKADPKRTAYDSTDFRVILLIDSDYWDTAIDRTMVADTKGINTNGMNGGESVLAGYRCAAQRTTLGFTYEAVIPWKNFASADLPVFVPVVGDSIGFDFVINDTQYPCPGEEYIPQIAWSGNAALATNPSVWGILSFK